MFAEPAYYVVTIALIVFCIGWVAGKKYMLHYCQELLDVNKEFSQNATQLVEELDTERLNEVKRANSLAGLLLEAEEELTREKMMREVAERRIHRLDTQTAISTVERESEYVDSAHT